MVRSVFLFNFRVSWTYNLSQSPHPNTITTPQNDLLDIIYMVVHLKLWVIPLLTNYFKSSRHIRSLINRILETDLNHHPSLPPQNFLRLPGTVGG